MAFDMSGRRLPRKLARLLDRIAEAAGCDKAEIADEIEIHHAGLVDQGLMPMTDSHLAAALARISACPADTWRGEKPKEEIAVKRKYDAKDTGVLTDHKGEILCRMVFPAGAKGLLARRKVEAFLGEIEPIFEAGRDGLGSLTNAAQSAVECTDMVRLTFDAKGLGPSGTGEFSEREPR